MSRQLEILGAVANLTNFESFQRVKCFLIRSGLTPLTQAHSYAEAGIPESVADFILNDRGVSIETTVDLIATAFDVQAERQKDLVSFIENGSVRIQRGIAVFPRTAEDFRKRAEESRKQADNFREFLKNR